MKKLFFSLVVAFFCAAVFAQRPMERLDRGLVAVKTTPGVYVGWRILGEEYYDTQYNLYRDGTKVNETPLDVSNYQDKNGTAASTYTVRAVVRGVEQEACAPVSVWDNSYLTVPMGRVYSRRGTDVTQQFELNDVSSADLDGDGVFELIVKRTNTADSRDLYPVANDSAYCCFEAYKLDGTKLWTIDCGPNLVSGSDVETNLVAYDWDGDGKAELLMRAADGTILPGNVVIGDIKKNYRNKISHSANLTYMTTGDEFLLYMEGATARLYNQREFPLKRLESGETDLKKAWGDDTGHRCNKFFFGAPFLDGRHPSIFLGRGIYTRHKMIAYDVNPATHELTERWRWSCNTDGSPWYAQGYHNYGIADVDWDGRDEIVYGSMVIDDNGKGLSTTGLGHGDAQHCGDLDPYRKGQEIFACLENSAGANYRDATTSKVYYRYSHGSDCGRCMAGNFTDDFLGSQMIAGSSFTSSVTAASIGTSWSGITQNFCLYWDGDLCLESMDYTNVRDVQQNGAGTPGVFKYGNGSPVFVASGAYTNNYTKGNPGIQCDLLGDWREEMVLRTTDNMALRVYTTTAVTPWRNYTLLHDMQYRQAIVWQMCGYNQPPHVSYFLGKAEGITCAPPPLTTNGRVEATDRITTAMNDKHVLLASTAGGTVTVENGAMPYILTVNAFSHTTGTDNNDNIPTTYSTYTLQGAPLTGAMRLVKQGCGRLSLPALSHTYTGETSLWGGVTLFDGELTNSAVWMNRFAELHTSGRYPQGIRMEYGALLRIGQTTEKSEMKTGQLDMNYGAIVEFDVYPESGTTDMMTIDGTLTLRKLGLPHGPAYGAPVFRFVNHPSKNHAVLAPGRYLLVKAAGLEGSLSDIVVEGLLGVKYALVYEDGGLYLQVEEQRQAAEVFWNGSQENGIWNLVGVPNFMLDGQPDVFVTGDNVIFDDTAELFAVRLEGDLLPAKVTFRNTKNYVMEGDGSLAGDAALTVEGSGKVTISALNKHTGKTLLAGGTTVVNRLSDEQHVEGPLGLYTTATGKLEMRNGAVLLNNGNVSNGVSVTLGTGGGELQCNALFEMKGAFRGSGRLTKSGSGALRMYVSNSHKYTLLKEGTLAMMADGISLGDTLVMEGGVYQDMDNLYSYSSNGNNFCVRKGKTATMNLDSRCTYTGKLYGEGTLNVNVPNVRTQLQGDWSAFKGTLKPTNTQYGLTLDNSYGIPKATLNIPSDVTVTNSGKTYRIGALTGSGTLGTLPPFTSSGSNTWIVGSSDQNFSFSGKITGSGTAFTKVGAGEMKVSGSSDFTGACNISGGVLCLNNAKASQPMLGTGVLTVGKGAALSGQGLLGNSAVTLSSGALLRPGVKENAMNGTLSFNQKNLNMKAGSTVQFNVISSTLHTSLSDIGLLNASGTIKVVVLENSMLAEGDEIQLWTARQYSAQSQPVLDLDAPGEGLAWDSSELADGKLKVVKATGIRAVAADETVSCIVYAMDGAEVTRFTGSYASVDSAVRQRVEPGHSYVVRIAVSQGTVESRKVYIP